MREHWRERTNGGPKAAHWGKVALGGFIGALALGATGIDVWNNHGYGASVSPAMAAVMTLAALGLTAIPGVAALRGWNVLRAIGAAVCLLTTGYCAVNAYAARQGAQILAAEKVAADYAEARRAIEGAREDAAAAKREAEGILEKLPSTELQRLYDDAKARRDAEATARRGGCGTECRKAEKEMPEFLARLGQAKAKEAALARAENAETRLTQAKKDTEAGSAEPNMIASAIAARTGGNAHEVGRMIALIMAMLGIAVTLTIACYMHDAVSLIVDGLRGEDLAQPRSALRRANQEAELASDAHQAKTLPRRRGRASSDDRMIAEERILLFAGERLRPGGETAGADVNEAVRQWWADRYPSVPAPSRNLIADVLTGAGINKAKRGGRVRYAAALVAS